MRRTVTTPVAVALATLAVGLASTPEAKAAGFILTGSMANARWNHTATLLSNGKVLVAGGTNNLSTAASTAELYDPATGAWTSGGTLNVGREYHTATLLTNGRVLVVGGFGSSGTLATTELYDPATGTWLTGVPLISLCKGAESKAFPHTRRPALCQWPAGSG